MACVKAATTVQTKFASSFTRQQAKRVTINVLQQSYPIGSLSASIHTIATLRHGSIKCQCTKCSLSVSTRSFFNFAKAPKKGDQKMHAYLIRDGNKNLENSALMAIEDYDQAINMQETSEAYTKRAFAYFYIKDYNQATKDVNRAIELNSRSIEAYCAAASIQVALEQNEEALEYLNTALELTSPVDFRRTSIEEVIRGCKLAMRTGNVMQQKQDTKQTNDNANENSDKNVTTSTNKIDTTSAATATATTTTTTVDGEVMSKDDLYKQSASQMVNVPFDDANFMNLQKDLTQQMVDIGGAEFQKKLMKLNDIPAVQKFQQKALKGEKPNYNDYMELMKDERFRRYNEVMTEIAKNPKFGHVTAKFANMDWMGAYEELKKDPQALALYMKAFDCLE